MLKYINMKSHKNIACIDFANVNLALNLNVYKENYSQVSNRRDSPLIDYSIFCHPPQPYSTLPVY